MWKSFPIQTEATTGGVECQLIDPSFTYTRFEEVQVSEWKDVDPGIQKWCMSIWTDNFGMVRCPLADTDLVGWIPRKGTIVGKRGYWVGQTRSRSAVYITNLYVDPLFRSEGLARKLIHSVAATGGNTAFLFEVDVIPKSLQERAAQPLCKFGYTWVPFTSISKPPRWKPIEVRLGDKKGFHSACTGWQAFQDPAGNQAVFDANNDIVSYTSLLALHTFDGFPAGGAYCRMFTPMGTSAVFAQNMYFPPSWSESYMLG